MIQRNENKRQERNDQIKFQTIQHKIMISLKHTQKNMDMIDTDPLLKGTIVSC
jgi:hypothetical protein